MAITPGPLDIVAALQQIEDALDRCGASRVGLADRERLAVVQRARVLAGRLEALLCALVAEADAAQASLKATGTPSSTWLATVGTLSKRESAGLLYRAKALAANRTVQAAALTGAIGVGQARAIATVLEELPAELDDSQRGQATERLVELAGRFDARHLAGMTGQILREVSPDAEAVEEAEQRRLQRQAEAAEAGRSLTFSHDRAGSVTFRGSLPLLDAEPWIASIGAYVESQRRNVLESRDRLASILTPEQRRADALRAMIRDHGAGRRAPAVAGDRPRVVVTMSYDALHGRARESGLVGDGERIGAAALRRVCCDADLVPAVLGSASEVLDVGRAQRLVTRGIRTALTLRDGGCVFPGCDTPAIACEAHHVVPWWDHGPTSLTNLVLLCHHHHALVEPAKYGRRDQWQLRIAVDGVPELIPPARLDAAQQPVRHQRFHARQLVAGASTHEGDVAATTGTQGHALVAAAPRDRAAVVPGDREWVAAGTQDRELVPAGTRGRAVGVPWIRDRAVVVPGAREREMVAAGTQDRAVGVPGDRGRELVAAGTQDCAVGVPGNRDRVGVAAGDRERELASDETRGRAAVACQGPLVSARRRT